MLKLEKRVTHGIEDARPLGRAALIGLIHSCAPGCFTRPIFAADNPEWTIRCSPEEKSITITFKIADTDKDRFFDFSFTVYPKHEEGIYWETNQPEFIWIIFDERWKLINMPHSDSGIVSIDELYDLELVDLGEDDDD